MMKTEEINGYVFRDPNLFLSALTHSSFVNERRPDIFANNERLEFLGDAVLELVVSRHIFVEYPQLSEGEMTKLRASVVCEPSLAEAAKNLGLGAMMRMGRGEEQIGGRGRGSILSDCFEAVTAAVFLDGGFDAASAFAIKCLSEQIKKFRNSFNDLDYKTRLQEELQKSSREPIEYSVIDESGPAHDKTFTVRLTHLGKILAEASGKNKKEAEQCCAKIALDAGCAPEPDKT